MSQTPITDRHEFNESCNFDVDWPAEMRALELAANGMRDALEGYRGVCGNTAYQVSRDSARELYDQSGVALDAFTQLIATLTKQPAEPSK